MFGDYPSCERLAKIKKTPPRTFQNTNKIERTFMVIRKRVRYVGFVSVSLALIGLLVLSIVQSVQPAHAIGQVYTVTNTGDNGGVNPAVGAGTGTLRQAIIDANANATLLNGEPHNIQFNIAGSGVHSIALQTALPSITRPTIIDGTTQSGTTCGNMVSDAPNTNNTPHSLKIEIVSSTAVTGLINQNTINISQSASGSQIRGLDVDGIATNGSFDLWFAAPDVTVSCSYFGVKPDGVTPSVDATNGGVVLTATADNAHFDNNMSTYFHADGPLNTVDPNVDRVDGLHITNNLFGVKATLDGALMKNGAAMAASVLVHLTGVSNTIIGGAASDANVFGGTGVNAEHFFRVALLIDASSHDVAVESNYVGITPTGVIVRNSTGIGVGRTQGFGFDQTNVTIGGSGRGNYVSGNGNGVWIGSGVGDRVIGNYIGVGLDGKTTGVGNTTGIIGNIGVSTDTVIGGAAAGERNIISGNTTGISGSFGNISSKIIGNYIGLDVDGNPLPNATGINLNDGNFQIGGSAAGEKNVISGNTNNALTINNSSTSTFVIQGNIIGLKPDGETPAPNGTFAADLSSKGSIVFGGANEGEGNIVAGNTDGALFVRHAENMAIKGNKFGVTKSGTVVGGGYMNVWFAGFSYNITIGGATAAEGNTFAGNSQVSIGINDSHDNIVSHNTLYQNTNSGVVVTGTSANTYNNQITYNTIHDNSATGVVIRTNPGATMGGNMVRYNSIYSNTKIGIDLTSNYWYSPDDGATVNDPLDVDGGANGTQNYPVVTASMTGCDGVTDTKNTPMFNSTPNTTFTIDYYANPSWDPNGSISRQGEQWVTSETVTTDANGNATLNLSLLNSMQYPSVTATDPNGNTSEFGSISNIRFDNCQDMLTKIMTSASTTSGFELNAAWTGTNIPATSYGTIWNGSAYVSSKKGLEVSITVGGQSFVWNDASSYFSAYSLYNSSWNAAGYLASPLAVGEYDVAITVTDTISGLSMTKTYSKAVKVVAPTVNYTTTITSNTTPTLQGSASFVSNDYGGLYRAYVVPQGTVLDTSLSPGDAGYHKQRALLYTPDKDATGNVLNTGTFKIITSESEYRTLATQWYNEQATDESRYWVSSMEYYVQNYAAVDFGVTAGSISTLADLKGLCSQTGMWDFLSSWWGDSITSDQECQDWLQQQYDHEGSGYIQQLQAQLDAVDNGTSIYDFSELPEGTYDIYLTGNDIDFDAFDTNFPGGLIIDLTSPAVTVAAKSAKGKLLSPRLNGSVSSPTDAVKVTITDKDGATYGPYTAINNGDGTWTIPEGTIQPGLGEGTYTVSAVATDLAGNSTTATNTLEITYVEDTGPGSGSGTGAGGTSGQTAKTDMLANTGLNKYGVELFTLVTVTVGAGAFVVARKIARKVRYMRY